MNNNEIYTTGNDRELVITGLYALSHYQNHGQMSEGTNIHGKGPKFQGYVYIDGYVGNDRVNIEFYDYEIDHTPERKKPSCYIRYPYPAADNAPPNVQRPDNSKVAIETGYGRDAHASKMYYMYNPGTFLSGITKVTETISSQAKYKRKKVNARNEDGELSGVSKARGIIDVVFGPDPEQIKKDKELHAKGDEAIKLAEALISHCKQNSKD